jgi:Flp pilus assembly pilin Flp
MLSLKKKKAQSIIEYAIVLAVVVTLITVVARGVFRNNLETSLNNAANRIGTEAQDLLR